MVKAARRQHARLVGVRRVRAGRRPGERVQLLGVAREHERLAPRRLGAGRTDAGHLDRPDPGRMVVGRGGQQRLRRVDAQCIHLVRVARERDDGLGLAQLAHVHAVVGAARRKQRVGKRGVGVRDARRVVRLRIGAWW